MNCLGGKNPQTGIECKYWKDDYTCPKLGLNSCKCSVDDYMELRWEEHSTYRI